MAEALIGCLLMLQTMHAHAVADAMTGSVLMERHVPAQSCSSVAGFPVLCVLFGYRVLPLVSLSIDVVCTPPQIPCASS